MQQIRPDKVVLLPEIGRVNSFYHLLARIVECVSKDIYFSFQKTNKQAKKQTRIQKKHKKLKKKI